MEEIRRLHRQAEKCRAAALAARGEPARRGLEQLAERHECEARRLNLAEIARH